MCHIGVKNLDLLVLLIKNCFDNPCVNVEDDGLQNVDVFGDVEGNLLDVFDMEFPNEVGGYVEEEDVQIGNCIHNFGHCHLSFL